MALDPLFRWVGGKRALLSQLLPLIPTDTEYYVEPFIGGGALWLAYAPPRGRICDANPNVISVYHAVKDTPEELIDMLRMYEHQHSRELFYTLRSLDRIKDEPLADTITRAARFCYLVATSFNGLWRENSAGQANMAWGKHECYRAPVDKIHRLHEYLASADIELSCTDYSLALTDIPQHSFVYLDPPYLPYSSGRSMHTSYTCRGFTCDDHERLRDDLYRLRERGVAFALSNVDTPLTRALYRDFTIHAVEAPRHIGAGRSAMRARELIVTP